MLQSTRWHVANRAPIAVRSERWIGELSERRKNYVLLKMTEVNDERHQQHDDHQKGCGVLR